MSSVAAYKSRKSWFKTFSFEGTLFDCECFPSELCIPRKWNQQWQHTHRTLSTNHLLIMQRTHGNKLLDDNDAIPVSTHPSSIKRRGGENSGTKEEVCFSVWKSNANKLSPPWYLNCFLFDNPIIVSRAVSIAIAISSWTNHSPNLEHFRFDSAIFWQFKVIRGGLGWGWGLILCSRLSC